MPIYQYYAIDEQGRWRYRYSVQKNVGDGWKPEGPAFYALAPARRTLKLSDSGADVRHLQNLLNSFDFGPIAEDGVLGKNTEAAVKRYQTSRDLPADGIVGPRTWQRINHDLAA